ncbi:hypothetical protein C8J56DRAFT_909004, partial [Mycena floridula]
MPKQAHHCGAINGCSGTVVAGQNCPKCHGYSPCSGGCGNYVLKPGHICPACDAKAQGDAKRKKDADKKKKKRDLESRDEFEALDARDELPDISGRALQIHDHPLARRTLSYEPVHIQTALKSIGLVNDLSGLWLGMGGAIAVLIVYNIWRRFQRKN